MKRLRVLFVSVSGGPGGAESSLALLARHMNQHEVHVAAPGSSWLASTLADLGARFLPLGAGLGGPLRSVSGCLQLLAASREVARLCRKVRPDIVHANSVYSALPCVLSRVHKRHPFVWHARDVVPARRFTAMCARAADAVIAVSQFVRRHLESAGIHDKITVIANGVELPSVPPSRPPGGPPVFANVGPFVPWKNQFLFLDAAELAGQQMSDAEFWIVGDDMLARNPDYARQLAGRVAASPLGGRVRMTGWRDMTGLWARIDCLVHTTSNEPFGRVVIEAMAHAVAVIVSGSGGPAEVVCDGVSGRTVCRESPEAFAAAMIELHGKPQLRQRLALAGRQIVAERHLAGQTAVQVASVYDQVLRTRHDASRRHVIQPR
jgi:glycosyltransferase involved in cell wall biosynthesis